MNRVFKKCDVIYCDKTLGYNVYDCHGTWWAWVATWWDACQEIDNNKLWL